MLTNANISVSLAAKMQNGFFQVLLFSCVAALEESGGPSPNLFGISFGQGEEDTEGELTITLKGASDEDLMALHR